MTDDRAIVPNGGRYDDALAPAVFQPAPIPPGLDDEGGGGLSLRKYGRAIRRFRWVVVLAGFLGLFAGYLAFAAIAPDYVVEGSLWIQPEDLPGIGPIRQGGLLQSAAWLGLLRSYAVLDSVAVHEKLYLTADTEDQDIFEGFELGDRFTAGTYDLEVEPDQNWVLRGRGAVVVDRGGPDDPVGDAVGFIWQPAPATLQPGRQVQFTVVSVRDAARLLNAQIQARMDVEGSFIGLTLRGPDPVRITSVLNSLMDRHVLVSADLKRAQLDEQKAILEEQLQYAEDELQRTERLLEEFRIQTITLPSDVATPIAPGLAATSGPVFDGFFQRKILLEQLRSDRSRLRGVLDSIPITGVRVEALEGIAQLGGSAQLRLATQELIEAQSQLRALRDRYSDDYPVVEDLLARIQRLETSTVPDLIQSLDEELATREGALAAQVETASADLINIPPRTIEEARLRRQVTIQEALYNNLRTRVEAARLAAASSIPDVSVLDEARVPEFPTNDERLMVMFLVITSFLGCGLVAAVLLDRMDPLLRDSVEVESDMHLEVLGAIPRLERGKKDNSEEVLEAFRSLRLNLDYAYGRAGPLVLTISSPAQGEGKTLVSTNLAIAFASVGRRTLLIDGDTRLGDANDLLGVNRKPGLTDFLAGGPSDEIVQRTTYRNLHFIGSGSRRATSPELVSAERMASMLASLKRAYAVIIIDSPPLAAGGDAMALAALTGALAIVVRSGTTNRELTLAKLEALQRFPVRLLGAVLNGFRDTGVHYYSNYLAGYEARGEGGLPAEAGRADDRLRLPVGSGS